MGPQQPVNLHPGVVPHQIALESRHNPITLKTSMLCAKAVLDQLQARLKQLRVETTLNNINTDPPPRHDPTKKLLQQLLKLHHTLHTALASHGQDLCRIDSALPSDTGSVAKPLSEGPRRLLQACCAAAKSIPNAHELVLQLEAPEQLATEMEHTLQSALKQELASIQPFESCPACGSHQSQQELRSRTQICPMPRLSSKQVDRLRDVVQLLRHAEMDVAIQAELAMEVDLVVGMSDFTEDNFAYGSTSFNSWLKVFHHPAVHAAVQTAMCPPSPITTSSPHKVMIWGSSLGWLAFYTHIMMGWTCQGYELLQCLIKKAREVADVTGLQGGVDFVNADLMESCLNDVGVLVLANQCWDKPLLRSISSKLDAELLDGTVVIEYTGTMKTSRLALLGVIKIEVSWNVEQPMHVWVAKPKPK